MRYCVVLRGTTRFCDLLGGTATYYELLRGTTRYYYVLRGFTRYYVVLRGATTYYDVLRAIMVCIAIFCGPGSQGDRVRFLGRALRGSWAEAPRKLDPHLVTVGIFGAPGALGAPWSG